MSLVARMVNKIRLLAKFYWRRQKANKKGISFLRPNYIFVGDFDSSSLLIDVGCGHEAEFALYAIEAYGCRTVGVDPTKKHEPFLTAIEEKTEGRFRYLNCAVASTNGTLTFFESTENESGSLLDNHTNVLRDHVYSYDVEAVTLRKLLEKIGVEEADFLKLDLEGAEYNLLESVDINDLSRFRQVFVEFHHHCIPDRSKQDTEELAASLREMGLKSFSLDDHNYLFYWPNKRDI